MKSASMSDLFWVTAISSSEMPAHLTRRGFQRFWGVADVRMVIIWAIVAQLASKIPSGLDVLTRPLI